MLSSPKLTETGSAEVPKRRSSRQRIETLVYADFGPGNGGFPINLSEEGMAFQGIQPLEKDRVIRIRLKLPGANSPVEMSGRIVWLNELGTGGGLEFTDLPEEFRGPIAHWVALQSQTSNQDESTSASTRPFEKRNSGPTPPVRSEIRNVDTTSPQAGVNSTAPVHHFASPFRATANDKSTAGPLRFTNSTQTVPRAGGSKRTWIMPFSIGVIFSVAIMVAIMCIFGVISVQFHLPQKTAVENPVLQAAGPGLGKPPMSLPERTSSSESASDRGASGSSSFIASSATGTQPSTGKPSETKLKAGSETSPEAASVKTSSVSKTSLPQGTLQKVAAAKLKAPHSLTSLGPGETSPPASVLPPVPEPTLQLPMISAKTPAPASPASTSARQNGNFDEPRLLTRMDPIYPAMARTAGVSGSVELQFTITADGKVRDVIAVEGNRMLVGAAVQAVQSWRYQPARLNGIPVEAQSTTKFNFKAH